MLFRGNNYIGYGQPKTKNMAAILNREEAQFQINLFIQSFKLTPKSHALRSYLS